MSKHTEALRLAEQLEAIGLHGPVAAELRRLHAENETLRQRHRDDNVEYTRVLAQRDALLKALLRIESAVDWYLGRSSFTQTTRLRGVEHSTNVRKELFAAHDEARAAIAKAEGEKT